MTAVQQVFSDLLALHPRLFNINSVEGREFVHHFHKYLAVEKEQILRAYDIGSNEGYDLAKIDEIEEGHYMKEPIEYYNETFNK